MKRLRVNSEQSDKLFALLVANGINATFGRRGASGDILLIPARAFHRARRLLSML